jgi:hypothetical protein
MPKLLAFLISDIHSLMRRRVELSDWSLLIHQEQLLADREISSALSTTDGDHWVAILFDPG